MFFQHKRYGILKINVGVFHQSFPVTSDDKRLVTVYLEYFQNGVN